MSDIKNLEIASPEVEYIQTETQLPGDWKEMKIACPTCQTEGKENSEEFVYLYDDRRTCYCVQCDTEFDFIDSLKGRFDLLEDQEIKDEIEQTVSNNPEDVSKLADKILGTDETNETRILKEGTKCACGGLNGCHFVKCPNSPIQVDISGYTEKECPHGWHYIRNCTVCRRFALGKDDLGGLPAHQHKSNSWDGKGFNSCTHSPQHIINGGDWGVWAGKKEDCRMRAKEFDIILNLTFTSIKEPHIIPIPELEEYEEYNCQFKEIQLDWPDFGVVNLPLDFWVKLLRYLEENKLRMLVFCQGGHGRTGTALAIMMMLSLDYTPKEAMAWINRRYCASAVETLGQEQYIEKLYKDYQKLVKKTEEVKSDETKSEALQQAVEYINKMNENKPLVESAKAGKE